MGINNGLTPFGNCSTSVDGSEAIALLGGEFSFFSVVDTLTALANGADLGRLISSIEVCWEG